MPLPVAEERFRGSGDDADSPWPFVAGTLFPSPAIAPLADLAEPSPTDTAGCMDASSCSVKNGRCSSSPPCTGRVETGAGRCCSRSPAREIPSGVESAPEETSPAPFPPARGGGFAMEGKAPGSCSSEVSREIVESGVPASLACISTPESGWRGSTTGGCNTSPISLSVRSGFSAFCSRSAFREACSAPSVNPAGWTNPSSENETSAPAPVSTCRGGKTLPSAGSTSPPDLPSFLEWSPVAWWKKEPNPDSVESAPSNARDCENNPSPFPGTLSRGGTTLLIIGKPAVIELSSTCSYDLRWDLRKYPAK